MFRNLLTSSNRFSEFIYQQRAINPQNYRNQFLINSQPSLKELIHPLFLYRHHVLPFDYDYYHWSCTRLLQFQKSVPLSDIILVMNLAHQYKVYHSAFWNHYQNQLYLRLYVSELSSIQSYYQQVSSSVNFILAQLKGKDKDDPFQMLTQQQINIQTEQNKQIKGEQERLIVRKEDDLKTNKKSLNKQFSLAQILEISEFLVEKDSQNIKLLEFILEYLTIKIEQLSLKELLNYHRLLNQTCNLYLQSYTNNQNKYTSRSIKNIYKYQSHYYQEFTHSLSRKMHQITPNLRQQLLAQMASFPIKKRKYRFAIGTSIIRQSQITEHPIIFEQLQTVCKLDKKMVKQFKRIMEDLSTPKQLV